MGNPVCLQLWCVASRAVLPDILDPKGLVSFSLSVSAPQSMSLLPKERDTAESLFFLSIFKIPEREKKKLSTLREDLIQIHVVLKTLNFL